MTSDELNKSSKKYQHKAQIFQNMK